MMQSKIETMSDLASEREEDSGIESSNADSGDNAIYIRISVPELKLQKCLQFHSEDTVWMAKERVIAMISRDLKDSLNYGLYCPPMNGKAGKFLDEERLLKEYPLPGPIGFLEFKYKRRVYKLMQLNPRKLKQLHARSNLKVFMDYVRKYDLMKLNKMLIRGLDPNFFEHETGETPLTIAVQIDRPRNLVMCLIGGGAHIDFRTRKEGMTPMHKTALRGNYEGIKTLLDLGASPNYKDAHGLTPLYHCVCHDTNPRCVELLLHDHAVIGVTDEHGWTEVHHACKKGRIQHLEHLLFYGADMNVQNSSGNTPLHVCAVNNQESCARVLLFRGADKSIQNYANQDAFQVAVIAGNCELADIINNFKHDDIVPFQEVPHYNEKRRMTVTAATLHKLQRSRSDPRLNLVGLDTSKTSSPATSSSSMPHFLANGTLFDPSGAGMLYQNVNKSGNYAGSEASMSVSSGGSFTGSYVSDNSHGPMMRSVSCDLLHTCGNQSTIGNRGEDDIIVNRTTLAALASADGENSPKTVVLQKGKNGFGFVLRGAKSQNMDAEKLEFKPTADFPALQYLDRVDRGSMADKAGLKAGDFLLEINGESVINATHEHTVRLIKNSGDTLAMKVVTVKPLDHGTVDQRDIHADGTRTLPMKKKAAPQPPSRHPQTSLTPQARAQASVAVESFSVLERLDKTLAQYENEPDRQSLGNASDSYLMNNMAAARGVDPNNKTASISRRTKRLTSVPLDEIFERQGDVDEELDSSAPQHKPVVKGAQKVYASPEELRQHHNGRVKNEQDAYTHHITRVNLHDRNPQNMTNSFGEYAEIENPAVANVRLSTQIHNDNVSYKHDPSPDRIYAVPHKHIHQEDVGGLSVRITDNKGNAIPPRPIDSPPQPPRINHNVVIPPPPKHSPPTTPHSSELVEIQTHHTYANVSEQIQRSRSGTGTDSDSSYESSFRPGTNARMSKEPLGDSPKNVGHSRTSSGTSSMSSSASAQGEYSLPHSAPSPATSRSSLTVSADIHTPNTKKYYEPEPDYDKQDSKKSDIPSLRSVRESWSTRESSSTSGVSSTTASITTTRSEVRNIQSSPQTAKTPAPQVPKTQSPYTPKATAPVPTVAATPSPSQPKQAPPPPPKREEETTMSEFGNAIKLAALAREKRANEIETKSKEVSKPKSAAPPPPRISSASNIPPPPPAGVPPPPPPPPSGPPPPPGPPPPLSTSDPSPPATVVKKPLPAHIQRQLDEAKKKEDAHAALMAAVAKRRNIVESADMENLADNIETRVNRGKKLQTVIYKSDQTKAEVKTPTSPTTLLLNKPKKEEEKKEEKKADDHVNNNNISKVSDQNPASTSSNTPVTQTSSNTDFLAAAERARQEWLQKKAQATLERKPGGVKSPSAPDEAPDSLKTNSSSNGTTPKNIPEPQIAPLGNFAQIIAQRAKARQNNGDGVVENHNNNNAASGDPANPRGAVASSDWPDNSVEIHGATLDYSQTDTPKSSRNTSFSKLNQDEDKISVSARKKMFESGKNSKISGSGKSEKVPPLVIPSPTKNSSPVHANNAPMRNGLKNSVKSPNTYSHEFAMQNKLSKPHGPRLNNGSVHSNGTAQMVYVQDIAEVHPPVTDLDFIPPPPLFDTDSPFEGQSSALYDDQGSMVSSVSTLSTLSSADPHDPDSPSHAASYHLVPPPPPGFDDGPSLSSSMEFIPPPMEFDTPVTSQSTESLSSIGTLRSVQRNSQSYSMSYPAVRSPGGRESTHQEKPIETWTTSDVCDWLDSIQLSEFKDRFAGGHINGQSLIQMGRNELIYLGVTQVGHRMAIERAIKKAMMRQ